MKGEEFSKYEKMTAIIKDWAIWMHGYRPNIGWPSRSVGIESGYASKDFDTMLDEVESEMFRLVDAAIDDLSAAHKAAINRCYGVSAVFRFPRGNYETLLLEAHETLLQTLPKKGVAI